MAKISPSVGKTQAAATEVFRKGATQQTLKIKQGNILYKF
jgi:hypothetical protein